MRRKAMEQEPTLRIRFRVPDLHCYGCVHTIGAVLTLFPGVWEVAGNVKEKVLVVEYTPGLTGPEALIAQMREMGFRVTEVLMDHGDGAGPPAKPPPERPPSP